MKMSDGPVASQFHLYENKYKNRLIAKLINVFADVVKEKKVCHESIVIGSPR